ncbi:MAG TPA: protein-glutamate O-methyltransferase CheR, partial [Archangium sp.]|nr:protein-glutamate O-methyltransferase CheR [Archangium sp.]
MSEPHREESAPVPPLEAMLLSAREFAGYQRLVYREAGIWLSDVKKALLVGRLSRRLRELGGRSFGDYLRQVEEDERERL